MLFVGNDWIGLKFYKEIFFNKTYMDDINIRYKGIYSNLMFIKVVLKFSPYCEVKELNDF